MKTAQKEKKALRLLMAFGKPTGRPPAGKLFLKGLRSLRENGFWFTLDKVRSTLFSVNNSVSLSGMEVFSEQELAAQREHRFPRAITFSLAVPLYNTPERFLREMIESVLAQTYGGWELCMADGSDAAHSDVERICLEYARKDGRIRYKKLEKNYGISGNTNACLEMAGGDFIGLLDHDDLLHPALLHEVMRTICETDADLVYTDEKPFRDNPEDACQPHFKPDYAPDNLRGNNYICHFLAFDRALLASVGLFDPSCDGSQDHDMTLRLTEQAKRIAHIPEILYYWRAAPSSVADDINNKPYVFQTGIRAVEKQLARLGLEGEVSLARPGFALYRIRYAIKGTPKISILIPNYEHLEDLNACLDSIFRKTTWLNYEIVIVENNSSSLALFAYYEKLQNERKNLRVVTWPGPFNYAAINNFGARYCTGDYLLLLNNDTEVITPDWLQEMLMFAQREDVGAVGSKLYYPNDTVQHAGVLVGAGGAAASYHQDAPRRDAGYMCRLLYAQDVSAVTGACILLRRDVWEAVQGLDEAFAVAYNDVDLCLRIRKAGYLVVWTPFAELYHFESKSRGSDETPENLPRFRAEMKLLQERWAKELAAGDPYYNPNFTLDRTDFFVDLPLRPHDAR